MNFSEKDAENFESINLKKSFHVQKKAWHHITNHFDDPCHIIEFQFGD